MAELKLVSALKGVPKLLGVEVSTKEAMKSCLFWDNNAW
jgi:hypothetical protein